MNKSTLEVLASMSKEADEELQRLFKEGRITREKVLVIMLTPVIAKVEESVMKTILLLLKGTQRDTDPAELLSGLVRELRSIQTISKTMIKEAQRVMGVEEKGQTSWLVNVADEIIHSTDMGPMFDKMKTVVKADPSPN